ncbi:hypothetical protein DSM106972_095500 [Dulcicalothrix desertica PCC 7102]|uniref:Uncharacterized protein n=1 Tax=Dulcicalothrix desertica PCC 7102 TaxID=232991 RepID=A0A433UIW6_9CYAN|nr:hypothetical protein [Dulcicalothrix desertica]RUS93791.1 hypothetical protein DSM106972_095500 [Dulcicalothrix desertica PCC 7102]TWH62730.1 hypothetical protein CAL7102_00247 [Dulcicalothrix desertica PCC 7102]
MSDKIQGKFYPLQNEEVIKIFTELTKSQASVLLYIRTLDPYGNGINIRASQIANSLKISRNAVYEAIRVLGEKDYLVIEDVEYTMRLHHKGILSNLNCDTCQSDTHVSSEDDADIPGLQQPSGDDASNSQMKSVTSGLKSAPETPAVKETQAPKNNKTYKDFEDSLSVEERESFLEFGLKMASDLPKPPQLPKKWIAKNWEEVRDKWLLSCNKPSTTQTNKWENHPSRVEWLNEINQLGAVTFMCDEDGDVDSERKEFFEWAEKANLIE